MYGLHSSCLTLSIVLIILQSLLTDAHHTAHLDASTIEGAIKADVVQKRATLTGIATLLLEFMSLVKPSASPTDIAVIVSAVAMPTSTLILNILDNAEQVVKNGVNIYSIE